MKVYGNKESAKHIAKEYDFNQLISEHFLTHSEQLVNYLEDDELEHAILIIEDDGYYESDDGRIFKIVADPDN